MGRRRVRRVRNGTARAISSAPLNSAPGAVTTASQSHTLDFIKPSTVFTPPMRLAPVVPKGSSNPLLSLGLSAYGDEDDSADEGNQEKAALETRWKAIVDQSSNDTYYWNMDSGEVTWTRPADMDTPSMKSPSKPPVETKKRPSSGLDVEVVTEVKIKRAKISPQTDKPKENSRSALEEKTVSEGQDDGIEGEIDQQAMDDAAEVEDLLLKMEAEMLSAGPASEIDGKIAETPSGVASTPEIVRDSTITAARTPASAAAVSVLQTQFNEGKPNAVEKSKAQAEILLLCQQLRAALPMPVDQTAAVKSWWQMQVRHADWEAGALKSTYYLKQLRAHAARHKGKSGGSSAAASATAGAEALKSKAAPAANSKKGTRSKSRPKTVAAADSKSAAATATTPAIKEVVAAAATTVVSDERTERTLFVYDRAGEQDATKGVTGQQLAILLAPYCGRIQCRTLGNGYFTLTMSSNVMAKKALCTLTGLTAIPAGDAAFEWSYTQQGFYARMFGPLDPLKGAAARHYARGRLVREGGSGGCDTSANIYMFWHSICQHVHVLAYIGIRCCSSRRRRMER